MKAFSAGASMLSVGAARATQKGMFVVLEWLPMTSDSEGYARYSPSGMASASGSKAMPHGAALSLPGVQTSVPSGLAMTKLTRLMPDPTSDASAVRSIGPLTTSPSAGAVIDPDGAALSRLTSMLETAMRPAPSTAVALSVTRPVVDPVAHHASYGAVVSVAITLPPPRNST